mmetsp:Transcript_3644/g.4564  ORF Transcript_3644/g.4564 Transcript_3644/m.4564 type:complete len:129 (-) Transcript_3644:380-766(-)|eukprot:CAMPEP_0204835438 /NCGR_PEP_ID=MMETSP1346-20131115/22634_1 /ASSEMBLY_ACC=CAM_ASM_000771 /TAXON_ID=215587 /ORGANISM="Aplanochytrium stocchinoi, Strain GSBS06" /LENGTH=128 /DNA_ID=CAMNT_0051969469 /DNA_START=116 /DNA_END=502 /DNA_ORIENTATION=+
MGSYDDVDLIDMNFDAAEETYSYPCPCGDNFYISVDDLLNMEDVAPCPSCSLLLTVVYDPDAFFESIQLQMSTKEVDKCIDSQPEDVIEDRNEVLRSGNNIVEKDCRGSVNNIEKSINNLSISETGIQ